jgi:hypothetical protein
VEESSTSLSSFQPGKARQTKNRPAVSALLSVLSPCIWTRTEVFTPTHDRGKLVVEPGSGRADPSNADKEAPIADDLTFFVGDWDPIKTCAGIIENTTTGRYSPKIRPLHGVFRGLMNIFKKTNQLNRGLDLILDRSILCEGRQQGSNVQQYALLYGA